MYVRNNADMSPINKTVNISVNRSEIYVHNNADLSEPVNMSPINDVNVSINGSNICFDHTNLHVVE